jgi:hypothetical protein
MPNARSMATSRRGRQQWPHSRGAGRREWFHRAGSEARGRGIAAGPGFPLNVDHESLRLSRPPLTHSTSPAPHFRQRASGSALERRRGWRAPEFYRASPLIHPAISAAANQVGAWAASNAQAPTHSQPQGRRLQRVDDAYLSTLRHAFAMRRTGPCGARYALRYPI